RRNALPISARIRSDARRLSARGSRRAPFPSGPCAKPKAAPVLGRARTPRRSSGSGCATIGPASSHLTWRCVAAGQPGMLRRRVAIRHSRYIIGDAARATGLLGTVEPLPPFGRHEVRRREEMCEEVAQNAVGLGAHAHHFFIAINTPEQEALDAAIGGLEWRREPGDGRGAGADVGGGARRQSGKTRAAFCDHILDETRDHPPHELVDEAGRGELRRLVLDLVEEPREKINFAEICRIEKPRPRAVVYIV